MKNTTTIEMPKPTQRTEASKMRRLIKCAGKYATINWMEERQPIGTVCLISFPKDHAKSRYAKANEKEFEGQLGEIQRDCGFLDICNVKFGNVESFITRDAILVF